MGQLPPRVAACICDCLSSSRCMRLLIALSLGFMCVFSGSLLLVLATERECARMHMCVIHKMMWYGEGFWGVLVFLLPAGGLLPTSSLINSTPSLAHTQSATLSLQVCRSCKGAAAKVLKMLLAIKSLSRRQRDPLFHFISYDTMSTRAFTKEEIHTLPPVRFRCLLAGNLLPKLELRDVLGLRASLQMSTVLYKGNILNKSLRHTR